MGYNHQQIPCTPLTPERLRAIYAGYKDELLSIAAFWLRDLLSAEDVLHDVFLHLAQRPPNLPDSDRMKAYLATCVVNRARYLWRRRQSGAEQTQRCLDDVDEPQSHEPAPDSSLLTCDEVQLIRRTLYRLPHEQVEVVVMHLFGSMTFSQIAECLDCPANTVQSRYRYGLEKMRSALQQECKP